MENQSSNHFLVKGRALPIPLAMPRLYSVLLGLLAVLLVVQAIRLVWLVVTPLGPVGDWQAAQVQVLPPQSRLSLFGSFDPFYRGAPAASANIITSLQLTLYGVRMNAASGLGSAILAGPDGVQESYPVGAEIMPGVKLDAVQFDHVMIDRGGVRESLYLDQSVPAETVGGDVDAVKAVTEVEAEAADEAGAEDEEEAENGGDTASSPMNMGAQ